jgi:hypothetical protein
MNKRRVQLWFVVALSLLLLSAINFARFRTSAQQTPKQVDAANASALKEISNYRQWTRVNERPRLVLDTSLIGG